jgi:hypothetical protein
VRPFKAFAILLTALLLDVGCARGLDALGLIEGLLSPNGPSFALLLPLAVVFYVARFTAWFIAPGLLLGALIEAAVVSFRPSAGQRI